MKIISGFKDFYDSGSIYGIDETRVYVRNLLVIPNEDFEFLNFHGNNFQILGVCGRIYPYVNLNHFLPNSNDKSLVFFNDDALHKAYHYSINFKEIKHFDINNYWYRKNKEIFDKLKNDKKLQSLFRRFNTPLFHYGVNYWAEENNKYKELVINPRLKNIFAHKIFSSVEMFQEIEMFLPLLDPVVKSKTGDDKVIMLSKGFDNKSFKKEKSNGI